ERSLARLQDLRIRHPPADHQGAGERDLQDELLLRALRSSGQLLQQLHRITELPHRFMIRAPADSVPRSLREIEDGTFEVSSSREMHRQLRRNLLGPIAVACFLAFSYP